MVTSWYEIEYRALAERWLIVRNGDGTPLRFDNITPARAALNDHGPGWRLVRVEESRTPSI